LYSVSIPREHSSASRESIVWTVTKRGRENLTNVPNCFHRSANCM